MSKFGIDGFNILSGPVSLYQPPTLSLLKHNTNGGPSLVIICSWMGAAPKYIAKYTQGYQTLYPGASILLIQCAPGTFFQRASKTRGHLVSACEIIRSHASMPALSAASDFSVITGNNPTARIVLHAFSNGGATMLTHLAATLRQTPALSMPGAAPLVGLPFTSYIFDCMPGAPNVSQAVLAFTIGLPRIMRMISALFLRVLIVFYLGVIRLLRREDVLTQLRRHLNDPRVFDPRVRRMYLYSKADRLIGWQDVQSHAQAARSAGFVDVREISFATSAHCALVVEDKARYWAEVRDHIDGLREEPEEPFARAV